MGKLAGALAAVIFFVFIIYGSYWVAKNVSYAIFYEDMVKQTITEMVQATALK